MMPVPAAPTTAAGEPLAGEVSSRVLLARGDPAEALRSSCTELGRDCSRLAAALEEMQAYGSALSRKRAEKAAEAEAGAAELARCREALDRARSAVAAQEFSMEDARRAAVQAAGLKERAAGLQAQRSSHSAELLAGEQELRKRLTAVRAPLSLQLPA